VGAVVPAGSLVELVPTAAAVEQAPRASAQHAAAAARHSRRPRGPHSCEPEGVK